MKINTIINKVLCEDCIDLMSKIPDNLVELTLTDIPYGVVSRKSAGLRNLDKGIADIETFKLFKFINKIVKITKGSIYIFCSTEQVSFIRDNLIKKGLTTRLCIWEKTNCSPMNGQYLWLSSIECCVYAKKAGALTIEEKSMEIYFHILYNNRIPQVLRELTLDLAV